MTNDGYWNFVPASVIYEIFKRTITVPGFQLIRKDVLARQVSDQIIQLIQLAAYKGGMYGFQWGVSLTYMPHRWENELRWHRSIKSAVLDLWDQVSDLPEERYQIKSLPFESIPSGLHGPKLFEKNLKHEWEELKAIVSVWLEQVQNLEGVLVMAEEQKQRIWNGPCHWPPPSLVYAFTLALLGRTQEATTELNAIIGSDVRDPNGRLAMALQKATANMNFVKRRLASPSTDSVK